LNRILSQTSFRPSIIKPLPLSHSLNGDGPPDQTGLVTFNAITSAACGRTIKYSDIAGEYNGEQSAVFKGKLRLLIPGLAVGRASPVCDKPVSPHNLMGGTGSASARRRLCRAEQAGGLAVTQATRLAGSTPRLFLPNKHLRIAQTLSAPPGPAFAIICPWR
jgi:hypothetical protein